MKTYQVSWLERHAYHTEVEAETAEEAMEMVQSGEFIQASEGEYIEIEDGSMEAEEV